MRKHGVSVFGQARVSAGGGGVVICYLLEACGWLPLFSECPVYGGGGSMVGTDRLNAPAIHRHIRRMFGNSNMSPSWLGFHHLCT